MLETTVARNRRISVDISEFVASHGRKPLAVEHGMWLFRNDAGEITERSGSYSLVLQWIDASQKWTLLP
jgi:hypothetical protein